MLTRHNLQITPLPKLNHLQTHLPMPSLNLQELSPNLKVLSLNLRVLSLQNQHKRNNLHKKMGLRRIQTLVQDLMVSSMDSDLAMDNTALIKCLVNMVVNKDIQDNRGHMVDIQVHNTVIQLIVMGSQVHMVVT
jgi:hypothetical protein